MSTSTTFRLRLIFTGLCTFVEHKAGGRVKVLLVDGRNQVADPVEAGASLAHCCGVLRFNYEDLDPGNQRMPDLRRDGAGANAFTEDSLCFLNREDLKIEALNGKLTPDPLSIVRGTRPDLKDPEPTAGTRGDWSWVADMSQIRPDAGDAQPWWFDAVPMPPNGASSSPILARFDLNQGKLSTLEFFRALGGNPGNPNIFSFNSGAYKQALASYVQCEIDCDPGTRVQITSTPWGAASANSNPLIFAPKNPGDTLEIQISDAPFYDVMKLIFPVNNSWDWPFPKTVSGHSFLHVYQLHPSLALDGPFPGPDAAKGGPAVKALAASFDVDKPFGCSPSRTTAFDYK